MDNLIRDIQADLPEEVSETLLEAGPLRVERIVSHGHASPPGFWYDQDLDEWVLVLKGAARLRFEDHDETLAIEAGDFVHIPAHRRHRVEWTTPEEPTVWLAIHFEAACDG